MRQSRIYERKLLHDEPDPTGGGVGVELTSRRGYTSLGSLPLIGGRAVVEACSPANRRPIPPSLWSDRMRSEAEAMRRRVGSWWQYGWFFPTLLVALLVLLGWMAYTASVSMEIELRQAEYLAEPAVGDVIICYWLDNRDWRNESYRRAYRIVRLDESFLYARPSAERHSYRWGDPRERQRMAGDFTVDDAAFSGEEERFSRAAYSNPSRKPVLLDTSLPADDRPEPLSVDFVLRPGG